MMAFARIRSASILPIGMVNTKTGKNAMFGSMWDCWEEDATAHNMLVAFGKHDGSGDVASFKLVHTCGEADTNGMRCDYHHDQTGRTYGEGVVVASRPHTKDGLKQLGEIACKTSIQMYTYK